MPAEVLDATIDGRFEPFALAGRGGMASVYRARDLRVGGDVALKIAAGDDEVQARFEREATALSRVEHPNVARYIAHGRLADERVYLAMEWIDGEPLASRCKRGTLATDEVLLLGVRVARALGAVHACGFVHRDVKPGNVVLRDGDPSRPVLLDFGLAKPVIGEEITSVGLSVGTPGYMAPEQARGLAKLDSRADLFALGCLLFRCATGQRPFDGPTVTAQLAKLLFDAPPSMRAIDPRISSSLDAVVMRLLAKEPNDRPRDASEVAAALDELAARRAHSAPKVRADGAITPDELHPVTVVIVSDAVPADAPTQLAPVESSEVLLRPMPAPIARESLLGLAESFGGVAESLANGALVVVFQGSTNARDQCARAARCAIKLKALAVGKAVVLATGRARTAHGDVVGEAVDRATAALAQAEKDGPVRIDEASALLLDATFETTRGPAFALVAERGDALATRTLLGRRTPFVGRDAELGTAKLTWSQCVEESVARTLIVTAEAGVGKSRLAAEVVAAAMEAHPRTRVWLARGDSLTEHAPLALLAKLVRERAGLVGSDPVDARRDKMRALAALGSHPDGVADLAEFLGELCGTRFDDDALPALKAARADPPLMSSRMRRAFESLVIGDAAIAPLLVVVEDLHWADAVSVTWLQKSLALVSERPVMLFALSRPEGQERFGGLFSAASHVHMRPLTTKASAKLARSVLGDAGTDDVIERITELAGGNAFYLEELLRAIAEGHSELPQTVVLMAQARLQTLDPEARRVLRAASVFGETFTHDEVAALSDDEVAAEWLPRLVTLEVIAHAPGAADAYAFRHALLREAAYASLTEDDRKLGHTLAARWLLASGDGNAMAVADHFARGGENAEAVAGYVRAAAQALKAGDLQAPELAMARGLACAPDVDSKGRLLGMWARALWQRGDMAKAEQIATEAMTLVGPGTDAWYDALADVVNARQGRLDHAGIEAMAAQLLATPPVGRVTVAYARALSLAYTIVIQNSPSSDIGRALTARVEEVATSDAVADPLIRVRFDIARAFAAVVRRDPSAPELLDVSARAFEEIGNVMAAQMQRTSQAITLGWLGEWEESLRVLGNIPEANSRPSRWARVYAAWPLARMGRVEEGKALVRAILDHERDDPFLITEARFVLGRLLVEEGRGAEAFEVVAPTFADGSLPRQVLARLHAIAHEALAPTDPAAAAEHAQFIEACLLDGVAFVDDAVFVRLVVVEHRRATNDLAGALALARETEQMVRDCAAQIQSPDRAKRFLERVTENARIIELRRELD